MTEPDRSRSPFRPQRLMALLLAGVMLSAGGALWMHSSDGSAEASDVPLMATRSKSLVTTTLVTLPAETTIPPPPPVSNERSAVNVPKNKYAPEPIVLIGTLEIPSIGLATPIYHGITMRNIDLGPSHWPGTPLPGEPGNTVFPGHRVTKTHPFRNIDKVKPGDQAIFTINGVRFVYTMTHSLIVKPTQMEIVNQTPEPTMTLFGCHPPGSARYRYVIKGNLTG
jgi:sortase A